VQKQGKNIVFNFNKVKNIFVIIIEFVKKGLIFK